MINTTSSSKTYAYQRNRTKQNGRCILHIKIEEEEVVFNSSFLLHFPKIVKNPLKIVCGFTFSAGGGI
jgi:hypothetical protein